MTGAWLSIGGGTALLIAALLQKNWNLILAGFSITGISSIAAGVFHLNHITGVPSTIAGIASICGALVLIAGLVQQRR